VQSQKDIEDKGFYSFRADANALGGFIQAPTRIIIPTVAPVSLPPVGGSTVARSDGFALDHIVKFKSAYSHVTGQELDGGDISIQSTAVIEGLNILEVVEADRIVALLSIFVSRDERKLTVSTAGSRYEGLRLGGHRWEPRHSQGLKKKECGPDGRGVAATLDDVYEIGKTQAGNVSSTFASRYNKEWAENRSKWTHSDGARQAGCSIIDGFESDDPQQPHGHIVEICGFGRVIIGELFLSAYSAQLVGLRVELGCPVTGKIGICCGGGGGRGDN
jgi:hypothetical protein